ncbi:MAG: hypothetical protein M3430_19500 [Acidobacteriota bacterium]|nr:hypothetical protein [Acidobacteriota bacterium]
MTSQHQSPETTYASTNRELFRPSENTGNPQYDFYTHYSRLSGLQRLALERHTVNGNQISRYEPDISHSTTCVNQPGFVETLQECAGEFLGSAALIIALSTNATTLAAESVRDALRNLDLAAIETADTFLSTDVTAPEFPALANRFASTMKLKSQFEAAKAVDHSLEVKIAAPEYAARKLGNGEDAAEFVRSLRLIAGQDASALYLQQLASHFYAEVTRLPVGQVLKEMGLLALEMSAVTATSEQLEFGDDEYERYAEADETDRFGEDAFAQLPLSERRTRWMEYAARVLGGNERDERASLFTDEIRAQARLVYRKSGQTFAYDEFAEHLSDVSAGTDDDAEFGAYLDSFERVQEQYDEGFAVSLHMTDGERKIACGDLDDDVDANNLPECARHLADELQRLYTSGFPLSDRGEQPGIEGVTLTAFMRDPETRERVRVPITVYGIDSWLDAAIDEAFGGRVARTMRRYIWLPDTKRPARFVTRERVVPRVVEIEETKQDVVTHRTEVRYCVESSTALVPCSRLHEQTETVDVCPSTEERGETRAVLEILLQGLKRDYHTRGLNVCGIYRELTARLAEATDTAIVARLKREAWQYKEANLLSIKLFNAFNTHALAYQAKLEAELLREMRTHRVVSGAGFTMTRTFANGARAYIVAQPILNRIPSLTGKTLGDFAHEIHQLPRQEQERVRRAFSEGNPRLYARVRDGLIVELERASGGKLRYFRWAFYAGNKPEHPIHTLTREDQAAAWELLKARSNPHITPTLPLVEADVTNHAITSAV